TLAVAIGVKHEGGPTLRRGRIAGLVELLAIEPARNLAAATGPDGVVPIVAELQVMRAEAGVDEAVVHRLRVEYGELAQILVERKQLGRRMVGSGFAEVWIVRAAERRRQPDAALAIEHRVVVVDLGVPQLLLAPIGRRLHRLFNRRASGASGSRTGALKVVTLFVLGSRIGNRSLAYSGDPSRGPLALTVGSRRSDEIRSWR